MLLSFIFIYFLLIKNEQQIRFEVQNVIYWNGANTCIQNSILVFLDCLNSKK